MVVAATQNSRLPGVRRGYPDYGPGGGFVDPNTRRVLNVGGGNRETAIPGIYDGWEHVLLDIDPAWKPDIVCDARELAKFPGNAYDAIYCAHNLEHYYWHEVSVVLAGFRHLVKDDGFIEVRVPDVGELMKIVVERGLDLDDLLYTAPAGPICARDVLYGFGPMIQHSGRDYFAHRTGFTRKSLAAALHRAGFPFVYAGSIGYSPTFGGELIAFAFKNPPTAYAAALLNLPTNEAPKSPL